MKLSELLSLPLLEEMIAEGYVTQRWHRDYDLAILNYTDKAQFDNKWNPVTRQCRGLIIRLDDDGQDAEIVARPFPKFFNYGQSGADEIDLDERAHVADKMDGSLGILYRTPDDKLAVATRGSFHSEQAEWATAWLHETLEPEEIERLYDWTGTFTDLFEIVYPENRVVVDYGEAKQLVYLGSIHDTTGEFRRFWVRGTPEATRLGGSLREALDLEPRENAEGVVVATLDGRAVKLKQEDYLLKHRARFNLTPRRIWETIVADVTLDDFLEGMPDEFHDAISDTWKGIEDKGLEYASTCSVLARVAVPKGDRKLQAEYIQECHPELAAGIFACLDNNMVKLTRAAGKHMEPKGPDANRLIA